MSASTRSIVFFGAVVSGTLILAIGAAALSGGENQGSKVRIGVFDSRAVVVAFAPSKFNARAKDLMAEYEKAKAAGDEAKMAELKAAGKKGQERLHFQGFGREPVDDLLVYIQDQIPAIGREAKVVAIVPDTIVWTDPLVEKVDVTDLLVKPFEPGERALKWIADLRNQKPLPAEEIAGRED